MRRIGVEQRSRTRYCTDCGDGHRCPGSVRVRKHAAGVPGDRRIRRRHGGRFLQPIDRAAAVAWSALAARPRPTTAERGDPVTAGGGVPSVLFASRRPSRRSSSDPHRHRHHRRQPSARPPPRHRSYRQNDPLLAIGARRTLRRRVRDP